MTLLLCALCLSLLGLGSGRFPTFVFGLLRAKCGLVLLREKVV